MAMGLLSLTSMIWRLCTVQTDALERSNGLVLQVSELAYLVCLKCLGPGFALRLLVPANHAPRVHLANICDFSRRTTCLCTKHCWMQNRTGQAL